MKTSPAGILALMSLVGCAHRIDCQHPELAAARRGVVLECSWKRDPDGRKIKSCLVLKSGHMATVSFQSCPVVP